MRRNPLAVAAATIQRGTPLPLLRPGIPPVSPSLPLIRKWRCGSTGAVSQTASGTSARMDVEGADDDHDAAAMPAAAHPADLHPFLGGLLTPPEDERGGGCEGTVQSSAMIDLA